jgi:serine protease
MKMLVAFALAALTAAPAFAQSKEYQGQAAARAPDITDQIIVKWRESNATVAKSVPQRAGKLTSTAGVALQHKRNGWGKTEVYKLDRLMAEGELQPVLDRLNADPEVEYAVADKRRFAQLLPSDPMVADQWYLQSTEVAATRTDQAWDVTTGSNTTIVAVLDTGVRPEHPDLTGKLLRGYDFISEPVIANDGGGRDPDATDTGDWLLASERTGILTNCQLRSSSWHGTRVSSLIAAATDEGMGMAGAGWNALILPLRVLGKCGGRDSDIIDAMAWAAGLPVDGVPLNETPAQIINLSLGGDGACTPNYQAAVNRITAAGVLIVASVGNEGVAVGTPANCDGVLGVSGLRHAGTKVGYSSLGPGADIGAPAGNCVNTTIRRPVSPGDPDLPCVYSILAAIDMGTTTPVGPGYTDRYERANFGTSFSAPLVSGAVALLHAVNPALSPAQYSAVIMGTANPFPTSSTTTTNICRVPTTFAQGEECICTTATCGAGMLNTSAAVNALSAPFGVIQAPATIDVNTNISIDARTSFDTSGSQVMTYQWSVLNVTGAMPTIANPASGNTTLQVSGTSNFTLRLRVTAANGTTDDTDFSMATVASTSPPPQTPIGSGGGGGGGGAFDWWLLLLGLLPLALPGPRKRKPARVRGRQAPRPSPLSVWQHASISAVRSDRRRRRQNFPQ